MWRPRGIELLTFCAKALGLHLGLAPLSAPPVLSRLRNPDQAPRSHVTPRRMADSTCEGSRFFPWLSGRQHSFASSSALKAPVQFWGELAKKRRDVQLHAHPWESFAGSKTICIPLNVSSP
jgi:hypothetical protein